MYAALRRACFMCDDDYSPRLSAAQLGKLAADRLAALRAEGEELHPVVNTTRKLAANFWGSAWMKHLAQCEAGGLCLAPGRTLLRHGCVLDLRIAQGKITAKVSADEVFDVLLRIKPFEDEQIDALRSVCAGKIDSLVSLLEGKVDSAVLQQLCDPDVGLLPSPADWRMSCTCPDWSEPCPHAAAAIYAAGCLIDADPSLLFTLRCVEPSALMATPAVAVEATDFDVAALSNTFGVDLEWE